MDIDKIVKCLYLDIETNKLPQTEFVNFMEKVHNPYIVLICCILSLRTNDKTTIGASQRMLELGKTPGEISKVPPEKLAKAIYPVGFYRNKAEQIIKLSKVLVEKYNSKVPDKIEELTKFKGVGRKTANLVLTKGYGKPGICVDVHVHRICNRLGYVNTKTPDETEMVLRKILPKKYWIDFNTLLVTLGQNICKPINPKCKICSINKYCKTYKTSISACKAL
jgi:endonuclease-3